jgi:hypothetical protein
MDSQNLQTVSTLLREALSKGKTPYLTVTSNSMSPLLRRGDQIGLSFCQIENLTAGDLVVMTGGEQLTTHRFWGTYERDGRIWLLTRGDRPLIFDPPWTAEQYLGRAAVRRRDKRSLWLDHGTGGWLNARLNQLARLEGALFGHPFGQPAANTPRPSRSLLQRLLVQFTRRALLAGATLLALVCTALGSTIEEENNPVVLTQSSHR